MESAKNFIYQKIELLTSALKYSGAKNIFLVTGKDSYELSGAKEKLDSVLEGYKVTRFSNFTGTPNLADIVKGISLFQQGEYGAVVAVGGGRVIDTAKAINSISANSEKQVDIEVEAQAFLQNQKQITEKGKPLIAIPTTAGSGSEATHFAVVYFDGKKYSLAHEYILPIFSIIDPELTYSLSPKITAESGMDALAQAIESYWSVNSTDISKHYSREAILLVMDSLEAAVNNPSPKDRRNMALAANFAGKAINIAKTTAPHAISYPMTAHFDVVHGQAAGITLPSILLYNSKVIDEDCNDTRGAEYVRETMEKICVYLGTEGAHHAKFKLTELMQKIGLKTRLRDVGINTEKDVEKIVAEGFNPQRMKNNPRLITSDILWSTLMQIR